MTTNRVALACGVTVGAALYSLYASFVLTFLSHVQVSQLDIVQSIVAVTIIGRFLAVMVAFGVKRTVPVALYLLFAADIFVTMVVIGIYAFIGDPGLLVVAHSIDGAAMTSFLVVIPACLTYFIAFEMARSQKIGRVLLSVLFVIGLLYFMVGYLAQAPSAIPFNGFPTLIGVAATNDISARTITQISNPFVFLPMTAIYSALVVYALPLLDYTGPVRMKLALPLVSTLVTLGGVFVASLYLREALVSFPDRIVVGVVPLSVILPAIWLLGRRASGRKPTVVVAQAST